MICYTASCHRIFSQIFMLFQLFLLIVHLHSISTIITKPKTHNKNSSDNSVLHSPVDSNPQPLWPCQHLYKSDSLTIRSWLPVWMQPGKRPEGEIGSLGTTMLASSLNWVPYSTEFRAASPKSIVSLYNALYNVLICKSLWIKASAKWLNK